MSTVWAVPVRSLRPRETAIFRFLKDARCSVRVIEVRLFKTSRLVDKVPMDTRRWGPGIDLPKTAREISKYIADSGSAEPLLWHQTKSNLLRP
jgi:hypothetical protein